MGNPNAPGTFTLSIMKLPYIRASEVLFWLALITIVYSIVFNVKKENDLEVAGMLVTREIKMSDVCALVSGEEMIEVWPDREGCDNRVIIHYGADR